LSPLTRWQAPSGDWPIATSLSGTPATASQKGFLAGTFLAVRSGRPEARAVEARKTEAERILINFMVVVKKCSDVLVIIWMLGCPNFEVFKAFRF
jgi:hypothetical protein